MEGKDVLNVLNATHNQSVGTVIGIQKSSSASKSLNNMFSSYMDNSGSTLSKKNSTKDGFFGQGTAEESFNKFQYKDNSIKSGDGNPIRAKIAESDDKLSSFEKEAVSSVSEELGIGEEELEKAMENLGFSVFDLLNPQNLAQVVMEVKDVSDASELLLDDTFLNVLSDMSDLGKDLMTELGMNPKQMQEMLEVIGQMEAVTDEISPEDLGIDLENIQSKLDGVENPLTDGAGSELVAGEADFLEKTAADESVYGKQIDDEVEPEGEVDLQIDYDAEMSELTNETADGNSKDSEQDLGSANKKTDTTLGSGKEVVSDKGSVNFEHVVANTEGQTITDTIVENAPVTSYSSVDGAYVIEQVIGNVRANITEDTTSLEMQLNPANLGKVLLNISSKQGAVSAQFTATNEMVKEALEAQLVTLRENLNQAGVKVDAIEVTVASHEFERNLEQDQSRQEQEGRMQEKAASHRRRNISLESLDDMSGLMSEEEALVAQMMIDNGNSVDLTA